MSITYLVATIIHVLSSAAWFGAMFYSLFELEPKALKFFERDEEFESFRAFVANGARRKVFGGMAVVGCSGAVMAALRHGGAHWWWLMGLKFLLWGVAVVLFSFVTYRLWPRRVFALPAETPGIRRTFRRLARALLVCVVAASALGVLARFV